MIALLSGPSGPGNTINNTVVENNYIDPTGAYGTFYPLTYTGAPTNTTITNNVDMTTGDFIEANNSEVAPTTVTKVLASPSSGVETHGNTITLTVDFSAAVTVSGTPTLSLNDGGTATYTGGSGTSALTFSYTVAATDSSNRRLRSPRSTCRMARRSTDTNGNAPNFAGAVTTFSGLQIGASSGPTLNSIAESPSSGDLNAGKTVTLTLDMSEAVTVAGRHPDAHPQRWRHRHLYQRLRHQCADLQLHGGGWAEHLRPDRDRGQPQRRHRSTTVPAMPPTSRSPA